MGERANKKKNITKDIRSNYKKFYICINNKLLIRTYATSKDEAITVVDTYFKSIDYEIISLIVLDNIGSIICDVPKYRYNLRPEFIKS